MRSGAVRMAPVGQAAARNAKRLARGRPFLELDSIQPVLFVQAVGRQIFLLDPAVHGLFRNLQKLGEFSNGEVHGRGQRVATMSESTGSATSAQFRVIDRLGIGADGEPRD
jgi:hypothetical protein